MPPIVTLLTDFGLSDTYAGQMRGVILGIAPDARIVDLTHGVEPGRVEQGAFLLEQAVAAFPPGTIHLAVVDPGVGSARVALAIETPAGVFIGPDNGLLSCVLTENERPAGSGRVPVPARLTAVALVPEADRPVSATFHGRDIFAVAAARVAAGSPSRWLGEPVREMVALPPFRGTTRADGSIRGRVLHVDRFGNLITSIRAADLDCVPARVRLAGVVIDRHVRTYSDADGLVSLIGSGGYLEVALANGNAARRLNAEIGVAVAVEVAR